MISDYKFQKLKAQVEKLQKRLATCEQLVESQQQRIALLEKTARLSGQQEWMVTSRAALYLNQTSKSIRRLIREGKAKEGRHYIVGGSAAKPHYRINIYTWPEVIGGASIPTQQDSETR